MQAQARGYLPAPESRRARNWESEAPSIRAIAVVVALTLAPLVAFSALSLGSSAGAPEPSTRHSYVVGGELVQPPAPGERTIADPVVVDESRRPRPGR